MICLVCDGMGLLDFLTPAGKYVAMGHCAFCNGTGIRTEEDDIKKPIPKDFYLSNLLEYVSVDAHDEIVEQPMKLNKEKKRWNIINLK